MAAPSFSTVRFSTTFFSCNRPFALDLVAINSAVLGVIEFNADGSRTGSAAAVDGFANTVHTLTAPRGSRGLAVHRVTDVRLQARWFCRRRSCLRSKRSGFLAALAAAGHESIFVVPAYSPKFSRTMLRRIISCPRQQGPPRSRDHSIGHPLACRIHCLFRGSRGARLLRPPNHAILAGKSLLCGCAGRGGA